MKLSCRTGFLVFFIKLAEVCKCFPEEWFITGLPVRNQSSPRLTYEPLEQPEEFSTWCPPWSRLFIHLNIDFNSWGRWKVGGGGGGATFEGWMVFGLQSLISFIFFIAYKEKHYIITRHNNTPSWVMNCGLLPLGTIKPKVRLTFTFFSGAVQIFACWLQHSMCK